MIRSDFSERVPRDFNLYLPADDHCGAASMSVGAVEEKVDIIASDPIGYWGHLGDATEAISIKDKRFQPEVHEGKYSTFNAQVRYWRKLYEPIFDKWLFHLIGNHEYKMISVVNIPQMLVEGTQSFCGGFSIVARFSEYFKLFAIHGSRTVNSQAGEPVQQELNDALRIKRLLRKLRGDCHVMAMAHIHKMRILPPSKELYLVGDRKDHGKYQDDFHSKTEGDVIHQDSRWYCSTGSSLRGYVDDITTYSEIAMYPPTELGMIKIIVKDGKVENIEKFINKIHG